MEQHTLWLDAVASALVILDAKGTILGANRAATRMLGKPLERLVGKGISSHLFSLKHHLDPNFEGETKVQGEVPCADGRSHFYECRINLCPSDGLWPEPAWLVVVSDTTERQQLRQERERLMEMAAINEVLPTILHEFKNPLASIQALVELLVEECDEGHLQQQLHGILMEIRRMKLGFEGLGTTTRDLGSHQPQALDFAVKEACGIFDRLLRRGGIFFHTEIATTPLLPLDSGGIRGILFNLLNNARQACKPGDTIRVKSNLENEGKVFTFSVADTGIGMSEEVLQRCTSLFFTTKRMGSGIGLALCKTAVEKQGGSLDIASELGHGTTITVRLPLASERKRSEHEPS